MLFSFVLLVYNEEKTVIKTLESIKYQIENYGNGKSFQIIIADDKSKDRTREIIDRWIRQNENLFEMINPLYYDKNVGSCKNLARAFREIKGEYFFQISGDDLIAKQNIFETFDLLQNNDMVLCTSLFINDNDEMIKKTMNYFAVNLQSSMKYKYIKWATKFGNPIMYGVIYRKELLTKEVLDYMEKFDLVEDRPRYYKMFQLKNEMKIAFCDVPIILYRKSEWSISGKKSSFSQRHNNDIKNLYNDIFLNEKNPFVKFFVRCQKKSIMWRGKDGIKKIFRYMTPYYAVLAVKCILNYNRINHLSKKIINTYSEENELYLKKIKLLATKWEQNNENL